MVRLKRRRGHNTPYGSGLGAKIVVALASPLVRTPCWLWQGRVSDKGYPYVRVGRRVRRAHIVVWERCRGLVAAGMDLDHRCKVRRCVNPKHLRPLTPQENRGWR